MIIVRNGASPNLCRRRRAMPDPTARIGKCKIELEGRTHGGMAGLPLQSPRNPHRNRLNGARA